jgi:DMSO/TMAO reductase YedYZ molybdopterin-dependent catalytic subunit
MRSPRNALARAALGGLIGLLAAGTAIGVGELVAAFLRPAAAPVIAVGNKFILLTPEPLKEYAIRNFGTNDKTVLLLGIYAGIAVLAVTVGIVAVHRLSLGVLGLVCFGVIGTYCALTADAARLSDTVPTVVGTAAAVATLLILCRARPGLATADGTPRRTFLISSAAAAVAGVGGSLLGRSIQQVRFDASRSRAAVRLPAPASPAPPLPPGSDLNVGVTPFVTPNSDFYRVDTALAIPQLNADSWSLRIHGMVDRPMTLSFADLLSRPLIERYITMTCVSNPVGGPYLGTAKFLGVHLADLLREAGVHAEADQIVGRSSDGMTIGTPTAVILDGRDSMLAVGMNGEPLPLAHGFPVRMVVPGLYGYVSGTKWIIELEATTFARFDTYWVQRKWSARAPIRIEARIDTPKPFASVAKGSTVMVAGVAWHQTVGISKVEVQVDDGPWQEATLGQVPSADTWVQWRLPVTVRSGGPITIRARATDRAGVIQDPTRRDPFPSGASGWHTVVVQAA